MCTIEVSPCMSRATRKRVLFIFQVLGHEQRLWLTTELRASKSPLKLIVVGSPVFNNPSKTPCKGKTPKGLAASVACPCFDDFDCYRPAQVALLHALARAPGCPVVITGDFHFSDLKVLRPGKNLYTSDYLSETLEKPIYQVMASGMTTDTAKTATCQGFHRDRMGLRVPGECNFVSGPAFGVVEVDWEGGVVSLQIRDGSKGEVQVETSFHLGSCTERVDVRRT
jgi:alkaline phosphatase D